MRLDGVDSAPPASQRRGLLVRIASLPSGTTRALWAVVALSLVLGTVTWALGAGLVALWCFVVCAVAVALALPFPYALVSPLFMGIIGWLVDMLPLIMLAGWGAVVVRWSLGVIRERRLPRGGRWIFLPIGLAVWTALGALFISLADFKHFVLLLGIQVVSSGVILAIVDRVRSFEDRIRIVTSLVLFIVVLSVGVFLQFVGVPIQSLQDSTIRGRVEAAYGLDAFPNSLDMIKYGLSSKAGSRELRQEVDDLTRETPQLPGFEVFLPKFRAFENHIVVRFDGSARSAEDQLRAADVELVYDNVGLAPANTVPRMRSFARNSLTYAGACVVLLPLAFYLAWRGQGRRRALGWLGVTACLFGAGFSLARGAWAAILIGIVYLLVDGVISRRNKAELVAAYLIAALVLTGFFWGRYGVEPLHARAHGSGSVGTRASVYQDTVDSLNGLHMVFGFGTEQPRTASGATHVAGRYIPKSGTHSTYLNYLFRAGVVGALGIMALYAIAALHARATSRAREGDERILATLFTSAVVMGAAHAVILSLYVEPIYTLTVSLILGLAMAGAVGLPTSVIPWRTRAIER